MSPTLLTLVQGVVIGLVAYRIWRLVAIDDVLARPRALLANGGQHFLECPWCSGFWITAVVTGAVYLLWSLENPWLGGLVATVVCGFLGDRL